MAGILKGNQQFTHYKTSLAKSFGVVKVEVSIIVISSNVKRLRFY